VVTGKTDRGYSFVLPETAIWFTGDYKMTILTVSFALLLAASIRKALLDSFKVSFAQISRRVDQG
jgi:hypothetical protein